MSALKLQIARYQPVIAPMRTGETGSQVSIHEISDLETRWARRSQGKAMPLRSTERSDGRNRPRWKDGSQSKVGERRARQPTDVAITDSSAGMTAHNTVLARDR